MHTIKAKISSGEKHVDAEYDAAYARFTQLHDSLVKLKSAAQNYSNSLYSSLFNSNTASVEFASILEDPLTENGYEVISRQMQNAHLQLNSDRQSALTARMSESVLVPLDKQILHLLELNTKATKRNELHSNLEYYLGKTTTLIKEREERGAKGKPESASQKDKMDRNQHKLDTVRSEYTTFAQPLIVEMLAAWQTRAVSLGPILAAFASVEKEFVQVYGAAIDSVHPEQIGTAPITASHIALQQRQAANPPVTGVTTTSTTTNVVTPILAVPAASSSISSSNINANAAINPFAGNTPIAEPAHQRQTSLETNSASAANPFGEINEPLSTTNSSGLQAGLISVPVSSSTTSTAGNPFEQPSSAQTLNLAQSQMGPSGGIEGAPSSSLTTSSTSTIQPLSNASSTVDSAQINALNKLENENKQQAAASYEADHKTANIIGV